MPRKKKPPEKLPPRLLSALVATGDAQGIRAIEVALEAHNGIVEPAAESLGVSRPTLFRWLRLPGMEGAQALVARPGRPSAKKDQGST